jgi:parallel beta-helix repeat protein
MSQRTYLPAISFILSLFLWFHAGWAAAKSFTLSDEQLLNLDCSDERVFHSQTLAKVTAKRDKPGQGVEFDLYFPPGCNIKTNPVYFGSSIRWGTGKVTGFSTSDYDAFTLKFGLVSVNDSNSIADWGPLIVGSLINSNIQPSVYRPYPIGIGKGMSRSVTAGTAIPETTNIETIGFTASMHAAETANIDANNSQGLKITLLIGPDPKSEILSLNTDSFELPEITEKMVVTVPDDRPTIQKAIDAAEKGTVVLIKPGDYEERLTLKSGVSIKGLDANSVIIHCDVIEGPVLKAEDCNTLKISGLTLKHTGLNKMQEDFTGRFPLLNLKSSQAVVARCKILNSGSDGALINGGNIIIRECNIFNNKLNGIKACGNAKVVLEKNNCSENTGNGIYFFGCSSGKASDNICSQNGYHGISCENESTTVNLTNNICEKNKINGIYFLAGAKGVVNNNTCRENGSNGFSIMGGGTTADLRENTASDNNGCGIYFGDRAGGIVTVNKCSENKWHGISVGDGLPAPSIQNNNCFKNKRCGLYLEGTFRATHNGNSFEDNGDISWGEICELRNEDKFEQLDNIASRLRKQRCRFANGNWQLSHFYEALGEGWGDLKYFPQIKSTFEDWIKQYPDSVTPRIALARAYKAIAWKARGSGYAKTVSEKGWQEFEDNLKKAEKFLLEAEDLNALDPELYTVWIDVGMGLGKTNEEMDAIFERGITIEKYYWPIYTTMGFTLSPRWGGKQGQFEAFARRAADLTSQQEGAILYLKVADMLIGRKDCEPLQFKQLGFSYKMLQQSVDDLETRYPDAKGNYLLNISCYLACAYNDREKALNLFAQIGDKWDKSVWQNEDILKIYKNWAIGKTESVREPDGPVK